MSIATRSSEATAGPPRIAPGPSPHVLLGNVGQFRRDPLNFLLEAAETFGDVVKLWIGRRPAHLLRNPDHIRHVLQTHQRNYPKRVPELQRLGGVLGQGLVTSFGDLWRRQRRVMQPAFRPRRVAALAPIMRRVIDEARARWDEHADGRRPVDVHREMMEVTFRVVGETLFSADLSDVADTVRESVSVIQRQANERLFSLVSPPLWLPIARNRQFRRALARLDEVVYGVIAQRRADGVGQRDLLDDLLAARHDGRPMSDRQLRDEILTLLLAGHENTGNALTWMWYLIAEHPAVERRLALELKSRLVGRSPTWDDLPDLPYTRMVTQEALRLYPTSWLALRSVREADQVGGFRLPKGSVVLISPYLTHRHPGHWPDPERFDPERFGEEPMAGRHDFAYLPFGAGARQCIGSHFAAIETQLVVATLAQRFHLERVSQEPVEPWPLVSLPPKTGILMRVNRRQTD